jgi:hypothetical protein
VTGLPVFKPEGLPFRCRQCLRVSILSAASTIFQSSAGWWRKSRNCFSGSGRVFQQDPEQAGLYLTAARGFAAPEALI